MTGLMVALEAANPRYQVPEPMGISSDFTSWMIAEQRRVYSLCQHMLRDRDEADSATQDVFLKAYRALEKAGWEEPAEPTKWLTRIAVNTCLDRLRSPRWHFWYRPSFLGDEEQFLRQTPSYSPESEDQYFAQQIQTRLAEALDRLSERQRAVFLLRHYEDLTLIEIAEVLNVNLGTAKAHMHRAISKLRLELRDLYGTRWNS